MERIFNYLIRTDFDIFSVIIPAIAIFGVLIALYILIITFSQIRLISFSFVVFPVACFFYGLSHRGHMFNSFQMTLLFTMLILIGSTTLFKKEKVIGVQL